MSLTSGVFSICDEIDEIGKQFGGQFAIVLSALFLQFGGCWGQNFGRVVGKV